MKTLHNGETLEIMRVYIKDNTIDAIICDLPYGTTKNAWDTVIPFDKLWEQYNRIIKDNGIIILFGQGMFFINLIISNKNMYKYDLVWDKILSTGFLNAKRMPLRQHEQIAVFYKTPPTYNPQFTIGMPSHGKGVQYLSKKTLIIIMVILIVLKQHLE